MNPTRIYRNAAVLAREHVARLIATRLTKLGPVTSNEAWLICREHIRLPYGTICIHMKSIMAEKVAANEADFIKNGTWFIYRQIK